MSKSAPEKYWKRLVVEGFVIVISILLAFSIDAWWDQQRAARDAEDQVARVTAELRASIARLEFQERSLDLATQATKELLIAMGPDRASISTQELSVMMSRIYGVPTLSLSRSAAQDFLSSGQLTSGHWVDIRLELAEMLSDVQSAERNSVELRDMRPVILERTQEFVSGLDIVKGHPLMADYPTSKFISDTDSLISDMRFEGLIATYAIRLELNRYLINSLIDDHWAVIGNIENGE